MARFKNISVEAQQPQRLLAGPDEVNIKSTDQILKENWEFNFVLRWR